LFFGESVEPLRIVGDGKIRLLQVTVLPCQHPRARPERVARFVETTREQARRRATSGTCDTVMSGDPRRGTAAAAAAVEHRAGCLRLEPLNTQDTKNTKQKAL
jgi:hypothetical protein